MDFSALNWVDWVFVVVVVYGAVMGVIKGLSHELAMLVSAAVVLLVTWICYETLAVWVMDHTGWSLQLCRLLSVVLLLFVVSVIVYLLRKALASLMTFSFKGFPERFGGLLVGSLRHAIIFLLWMLVMSFVDWPALQRAIMLQSKVGNSVLPHMIEGYNQAAEKLDMLQAHIPVGVEVPQTIMPPQVEPGAGTGYELPPEWGN